MSNYLYRIYKYFKHQLTARHSYGYGIHSPYIYYFTKFVIYEKNSYYIFSSIESIRSLLKKDNSVISVTNFGTGTGGNKVIKDIARTSLKSPEYGQLLFRIVNFAKCKDILELGTSLGLTTCYLASGSGKSHCITMEGCPETAKIARRNFDKLHLDNIDIVIGDINKNLAFTIEKFDKLDFLFIDANHRSEAVLNYFEECLPKLHNKTIMVVDDIYWSKDMEEAWKSIKRHERVTSTIDLFQIGIVFFDPDLYKKNYKMRF